MRADLGAVEFLAPDLIQTSVRRVLPPLPSGPAVDVTVATNLPNGLLVTLFEVVTPSSPSDGPWAGLGLTHAEAAAQFQTMAAPFVANLSAAGGANWRLNLPPGVPTPLSVRAVSHAIDPVRFEPHQPRALRLDLPVKRCRQAMGGGPPA